MSSGVVMMLFVCAKRRSKAIEQSRRLERTKTRTGKGPENLKKFTGGFPPPPPLEVITKDKT